jgi:hypothetical protein
MKRILPIGFLLLTCVCFFCLSSSTGAAPFKRPLAFESFTPKEGLSSEMVYAIGIRGDEIWFGTYAGGATLFDRVKKTWKAYTTKGEPQAKSDDGTSINWKNRLPYNHVSVIQVEPDRVWFGTYFYGFGGGGISYYQPTRTPPWKPFDTYPDPVTKEEQSKRDRETKQDRAKKVVSMALDGNVVWVGSEVGLSVLDKVQEKWKTFYSTKNGLVGNFVHALLVQPDTLWVGSNGGLSRLTPSKNTWKPYPLKEGQSEVEIKALAKAGQRIWAAAVEGILYEYDPSQDKWRRFESTDPLKTGGINAMTAGRDRVYVCRDNGVSVFDLATSQWEAITAADGLLSNTVFSAAEDRNGVWFGTDKGACRMALP